MTHAPHAEDAARHRDDVVRGPSLGLVDREDAGERTLAPLAKRGPRPPAQAIPSAIGGAARATASASRAARSTTSRTSAALPVMSAPAART